jgi:hypothetical protein
MARTDAHRPYYVLEVDEPNLAHFLATHNICACSWCGGSHYRFRERRWWRHRVRQQLNDARKLDDWDDLDVWPRYKVPW